MMEASVDYCQQLTGNKYQHQENLVCQWSILSMTINHTQPSAKNI